MMKTYITILLLCLSILSGWSATYTGRVVDVKGNPIAYATVYPEVQPELGTATNHDGLFSFNAILTTESNVIISFIGYEKTIVKAPTLLLSDSVVTTIVMHEQPIALEETVVAAKASKQRNKRKRMAELLHAVYVQLERDFPDQPAQYKVVSDVRMQSSGETWGMEQMISNIVVMPEQAKEGRDSIQFQGLTCKRFFDAQKRAQADSILSGNTIERLEKDNEQKFMRKAAYAVDSGVVVHRTLFSVGNMRYDFEQAMNDLRNWTVTNESEGETVLTHEQKISKYLGCFKIVMKRHYIVDSRTYAVRRFSEHAEVKVVIPFGVKLNKDELLLLNLINMDDNQIERFRLRRVRGKVDLNTIYQRQDGHVYTQEKNMIANMYIIGAKKMEIPLRINATQRVTDLQTIDVSPMSSAQITSRVPRQIVEIY